MKVELEARQFQPVTIVLETKEEFDHMLAALNTTATELNRNAKSLGYPSSWSANSDVYGVMYNRLSSIRDKM